MFVNVSYLFCKFYVNPPYILSMEHFNVDFTFFSVNLRSDYPHYNKLAERLSYIWCRNIYYIFMSIFNDLQLTAVIKKRIRKTERVRSALKEI